MLHQRHFKRYTTRGPLSSVLYRDAAGEFDHLTIFWELMGEDPTSEEEAEALLVAREFDIVAAAEDRSAVKAAAERAALIKPHHLEQAAAQGALKRAGPEAEAWFRRQIFKAAVAGLAVVRGVENDPDANPERQREIVRQRARKDGFL